MKRLVLAVLLSASPVFAQEAGPQYVHMLFDRVNGVIYPYAANEAVTNNASVRDLRGSVSAVVLDVQALRLLVQAAAAGIASNSAYAHDLETRIYTDLLDHSASISELSLSSSSNAAHLSVMEGEVSRLSDLQATNSMLSARAMAMVYDFSGRVQGNADSISANSLLIESNAASITDLRAALDELSGNIGSSQPAIETPDGLKWKAVGVYMERGKPTFAWTRCTEGNYGAVVLDMPDDRHFKMTGMYTETGKVTHKWEEITNE